MNPLMFGALLLAGSHLIKSVKESKVYNDEISKNNDLLNNLLEKKKLLYMKSGLKLTGSVLDDLETTKKNASKTINELNGRKENLWISSILGIPMEVYRYSGSEYFKRDLFGKVK